VAGFEAIFIKIVAFLVLAASALAAEIVAIAGRIACLLSGVKQTALASPLREG
jgi:hypothetical protein